MTARVVGTDSSGRPIRMTPLMERFWRDLVSRLGFTPTIVQGAWMAGAGASQSAGYHDQGGPLDLRTWDLTPAQVTAVIREWRALGGPIWLRDERHGMDPHLHGVVGGDEPMAPGARWQIEEYAAGRDGLTSRGRDYHPRPNPLVTRYRPSEEDDMPTAEEIADAVWTRPTPMGKGNDPIPAQALLRQARNQSAAAKVDPTILAAAIVRAMPAGRVDEATVEAGVLSALRKLVNEE